MEHRYRPLARLSIIVTLFAILVAGLPAAAQGTMGGSFPPAEGTVWGDAQALGEGEIQTFITSDSSGMPMIVGVYLTEGALSGLSEELSDGTWDIMDADDNVVIPCCGHETILEFPESDAVIPFQHVVVNWNPLGHAPAEIYDLPHFDLHFYTISNEDRTAIAGTTADEMCMVPNPPGEEGEHPVPVSCETFEEAMIPLDDSHMPPGYMAVGAVEPGMGNHLINTQAPEMAGEPFTHTWIYGAYAGQLTFYEPMITLAYLEEQNEETCTEIVVPGEMPEAGYYPTQYCIRYLAGEDGADGAYVISLEGLTEF